MYVHSTQADKVLLGASALLVNGWVVGTAGTALVCAAARARNVPVLVCAERHKVSERVHTDAFICNQLGKNSINCIHLYYTGIIL